ncbi:hypothetical protein NW762_007399 [Fusarium torreyae]|uniref:NACHT domain-containing protein n=1 Tax=Fusarium torreyae TaxID=1237075 RepID=A0A9W8RZQ6_9HYPO|nr:hypothetical protein NW762_007399 [Fusarium torreyae]
MSLDRAISSNCFGDNARIHQGDVNNYHSCSQDEKNKCLIDLRVTDPRDDKIRIEGFKGGLLKDSYRWILDHKDFQQWQQPDSGHRFLWIKGDPGKGKTMLLCGIIDELNTESDDLSPVVYFLCQATDARINNATAVLRGLIFMVVRSRPPLFRHLWKEYEHAGRQLFEDPNAFTALSTILATMVKSPEFDRGIIIIDALDECTKDLELLLKLIVKLSQYEVRCIVSSRNWPEIDILRVAAQSMVLRLELNERSISKAVQSFIAHRSVMDYLKSNCDDTFLWVTLVCEILEKPQNRPRHVFLKLKEFPSGLDAVYQRMLQYLLDSDDRNDCKQILEIALTVYRPISLEEMASLYKPPQNIRFGVNTLKEIIQASGSFLVLRGDFIYFIHQSAKDFLTGSVSTQSLTLNIEFTHCHVFSQCLVALTRTLKRNIYGLDHPGVLIEDVETPKPDPLTPIRYLCIYWVNHLHDCDPPEGYNALRDSGPVNQFLRRKLLNWLEALCLLRSIPVALRALKLIQNLLETFNRDTIDEENESLLSLTRDALRFVPYFKPAIEAAPLQVYVSGLAFSPERSLVRMLYHPNSIHD